MATNAAQVIAAGSVAKLVPGGAPALARLSDDELLASTRRLVGKSNQLLAALLVHLAEVETRGAHRTRRCASLYTYCIYELRFSEDAAARRSAAARLVKQFPVLLDAIADGELHLTGLLMIGPHLTLENHAEVLARAKFRTKKELAKLVRDLNPLPGVPDCVQPLGAEAPRALRTPTWAEYVESLCPPVRDLPQGERPRDWIDDPAQDFSNAEDGATDVVADDEALPVGPIPADLPPVTKPQQYQVQFSTTEEHAQLIERAKALFAREHPSVTLGELHLEAMKLLVASLEKRKFAVGAKPRTRPSAVGPQSAAPVGNGVPRQRDTNETRHDPRGTDETRRHDARGACELARPRHDDGSESQQGAREPSHPNDRRESPHENDTSQPPRPSVTLEPPPPSGTSESPRQRGTSESPRQRGTSESPRQSEAHDSPRSHDTCELTRWEGSRQRGRHIPAAERRTVYGRDEARCGYVDARGERCHETRCLEVHHLRPFARGGTHDASNLTLRCPAHNDLAAEDDFGREVIAQRRDSASHESLARQLRTARRD